MVDINENALYMLKQEFLVMKRKKQMNDSIQLESLIVSIREREETISQTSFIMRQHINTYL